MNSSITDPSAHLGAAPHKIRICLQIVKARRQIDHLWSTWKFPKFLFILLLSLQVRRIQLLVTNRSDLVLSWPEWLMIPLFLWPKQHPVAEGKSQTAHTAAEAEVPVHMSQSLLSCTLQEWVWSYGLWHLLKRWEMWVPQQLLNLLRLLFNVQHSESS